MHSALSAHPRLHMASVKEPKFFMCDGRRPRGQKGPGDAHSVQEWICRFDDYAALFADAPPDSLCGESTPFYLYDRGAQLRIADAIPDAKLVVIVRDPVDRAYSNWMHAWSDGLEPIGDFMAACAAEDARIANGWAPFWHYRHLGLYGEQLEHLYRLFPEAQVHVLRYKELVDTPLEALNAITAFLGVEQDLLDIVPPENSRRFVVPSARNRVLASAIRTGAAAGALMPPKVWRTVSVPLVRTLQRGGTDRPKLAVEDRRALVRFFADDIGRLERLTGRSYNSWLGDQGRGEFASRRLAVAQ